jgi:esterase/lipase
MENTNQKQEKVTDEETITIPASEARKLRELVTLQEIKSRVTKWGLGWLAGISLLLSIIGMFGVEALVKSVIEEKIKEANVVLRQADVAAQLATDVAEKAKREVEITSKTIDQTRTRIATLDKQVVTLAHQIDDASQRYAAMAETKIENLQGQVNLIAAELEKIRGATQLASVLQSKLNEIRMAEDKYRKTFEENSRYIIFLSYHDGTDSLKTHLAEDLRAQGFRVSPWRFRGRSVDSYMEEQEWDSRLNLDKSSNAIAFYSSALPQAQEIRKILEKRSGGLPVKMYKDEHDPTPYRNALDIYENTKQIKLSEDRIILVFLVAS